MVVSLQNTSYLLTGLPTSHSDISEGQSDNSEGEKNMRGSDLVVFKGVTNLIFCCFGEFFMGLRCAGMPHALQHSSRVKYIFFDLSLKSAYPRWHAPIGGQNAVKGRESEVSSHTYAPSYTREGVV